MANVCLLHSILLLLVQLSWKHVVYAIEWPISCIDTTELCITASAISDLFQLLNFYSLGARSCHNHFVLCVFFCVCTMSVISILFTWFPLTFFGKYFFLFGFLMPALIVFFPFILSSYFWIEDMFSFLPWTIWQMEFYFPGEFKFKIRSDTFFHYAEGDREKWRLKNGGEILSSLILFQSMHSLRSENCSV